MDSSRSLPLQFHDHHERYCFYFCDGFLLLPVDLAAVKQLAQKFVLLCTLQWYESLLLNLTLSHGRVVLRQIGAFWLVLSWSGFCHMDRFHGNSDKPWSADQLMRSYCSGYCWSYTDKYPANDKVNSHNIWISFDFILPWRRLNLSRNTKSRISLLKNFSVGFCTAWYLALRREEYLIKKNISSRLFSRVFNVRSRLNCTYLAFDLMHTGSQNARFRF